MGTAGQVVLLIDGAAGLEHMGRDCFKEATQIVDFFHAMEHAGTVLEALIGQDHPDYKARLGRWAKRLLHDGVQKLIIIGETPGFAGGLPKFDSSGSRF